MLGKTFIDCCQFQSPRPKNCRLRSPSVCCNVIAIYLLNIHIFLSEIKRLTCITCITSKSRTSSLLDFFLANETLYIFRNRFIHICSFRFLNSLWNRNASPPHNTCSHSERSICEPAARNCNVTSVERNDA
jgi:hypothetical protein